MRIDNWERHLKCESSVKKKTGYALEQALEELVIT
jgi:hypothetical protein